MAIPCIIKYQSDNKSIKNVTVFVDGKPRTIDASAPLFNAVFDALKNQDVKKLSALFQVKKSIAEISNGRFKIYDDETLMFDGKEVKNVLVSRMVAMLRSGLDVTPLCLFLENLLSNPSQDSINETYLFLEHNDLPITEDGHFLAYKAVRYDFMDCHSGTFDNSPGKTVEMPREGVNPNRHETCSTGLHFCSRSYIGIYSGGSNRLVVVKINPRDVVSIPSDYNNAKGRCCKYVVLEEISWTAHIVDNFAASDKPVVNPATPETDEDSDGNDECPECGEYFSFCCCEDDPECGICGGNHYTEDHEDEEEETEEAATNTSGKLSVHEVREIRKLLDAGNLSLTAIGNMFGVHRTQIQRIRDGISYANVF